MFDAPERISAARAKEIVKLDEEYANTYQLWIPAEVRKGWSVSTRGESAMKDYSEIFELSGASIRIPKGTDSTNYRGWVVEKYGGVQLGYRTAAGPGKGRKTGGYLLTKSEDGAKKFVGNLKEAQEYIDEYEGM